MEEPPIRDSLKVKSFNGGGGEEGGGGGGGLDCLAYRLLPLFWQQQTGCDIAIIIILVLIVEKNGDLSAFESQQGRNREKLVGRRAGVDFRGAFIELYPIFYLSLF